MERATLAPQNHQWGVFRMSLADDLVALSDKDLAKRLKSTPQTAAAKYKPLLSAIAVAKEPQTPEHLAASLSWSPNEVRERLTRVVAAEPSLFERTAEFMPDVATIIGLVEASLGTITSTNLAEANQVCADIVTKIVRPRYKSFIRRELQRHIDLATDNLAMNLDELVAFLLDGYKSFVTRQEQGLTSKAGGLNEAIIARGLTNEGLVAGIQFEVTGKMSKGDLAVYCDTVTPKATLLVEVKSWGSRERLLRGLQDIQPPKIGVGFFNSASEFNPERTNLFLATQALAIYMPQSTYAAIDATSRARLNARGSSFYRPLSQFVGDMKEFTTRGVNAYSP